MMEMMVICRWDNIMAIEKYGYNEVVRMEMKDIF